MKQIRFAIIGTGNITRWFLNDAALDRRFKATALYSRTPARGEDFAAQTDIPKVFTSLDEMLEYPEIDAVYIASPNHLHASQAIKCMNAGKHVLCEKPMASNAAEAKEMIETAQKNGVTLMEALISTLNPNFAIVKDSLSRLGKIHRYFSSYCQYSTRFDRFKAGELPNVFNPQYSAGALMDIGIYTIYPMVSLFGKPNSIHAEGLMLSSGVDAQGTISCQYADMEATLIYSKIVNSYLPTELEGEQGNLLIDAIHNIQSMTLIPRPAPTSGRDNTIEKIALGHSPSGIYQYEVLEFINLIESGIPESSVNSLSNSLATIEIMDEIRKQLGVTFPADKNIQ